MRAAPDRPGPVVLAFKSTMTNQQMHNVINAVGYKACERPDCKGKMILRQDLIFAMCR